MVCLAKIALSTYSSGDTTFANHIIVINDVKYLLYSCIQEVLLFFCLPYFIKQQSLEVA